MSRPRAIPSRFETADAVRAWLAAFRDELALENPHRQFVAAYVASTDGILELRESGRFHDVGTVERYVTAFADRYVDALEGRVGGRAEEIPVAWRLAFDPGENGSSPVLGLLLGASAHINHDLAFAVVDAGIDPSRPSCRADHAAIGRDAYSLVSACLDSLAAVQVGLASLRPLSRFMIVGAAGYALRRGREVAWRSASRLLAVASEDERGVIAEKIARRAEAVGRALHRHLRTFDPAAGAGRTWWSGLRVMACLRGLLR